MDHGNFFFVLIDHLKFLNQNNEFVAWLHYTVWHLKYQGYLFCELMRKTRGIFKNNFICELFNRIYL